MSFFSSTRCRDCWLLSQGALLLPVAIGLAVGVQVMLRSGMTPDVSWWKLVVIRGAVQTLAATLALVVKAVVVTVATGGMERREGGRPGGLQLVTRCTFTLRSHRTAYFTQALLSFVFVAAAVETVARVPASTLATVFHLMPIILIAVDNARAR